MSDVALESTGCTLHRWYCQTLHLNECRKWLTMTDKIEIEADELLASCMPQVEV